MEEKIGKVILDTTCYPGKDLYSDGAIEDEMLAISRDFAPEEFNRVISERKSWPILYHFSHIRECIRHREQNVENLSILLSRSSIYPEARAS